MWGFEPPELLVQASLYYFAIVALLARQSYSGMCVCNILSSLHYTGAGVCTLHIDVMETDRQRCRVTQRDRTRAQAKAPLFNLNVQEE